MPELPEVHTITTDIKPYLEDSTIINVEIRNGYRVLPDTQYFKKNVSGAKISTVRRVAKNIILELSNEFSILIHLAMTGRVLYRELSDKSDGWERVVFKISKNGKEKSLRFCDMRMFGKMALLNQAQIQQLGEKYGPEPINYSLSPSALLERLRGKRTSIKGALLDQSVVSGLGNIYATDALFISKIHPETHTKDVSLHQAENLLAAAREILEEGIVHRGATLDDKAYVDAFGNYGTHQNYFRIYGKSLCPNCKSKVETVKINGRTTYFCPRCQTKGFQKKLL